MTDATDVQPLPPEPEFPLPRAAATLAPLRETIQRAVDATTLRAVAGEIGVSPQGLLNFLSGLQRPQPRTVQKLREWDLRRRANGGDDAGRTAVPPDVETIHAALQVLTWELAGERRERAMTAVITVLHNHGIEFPPGSPDSAAMLDAQYPWPGAPSPPSP
jgi:transcriptional regulator with XRE-family HTH domain